MIITGKLGPVRNGDDERRLITAFGSKNDGFELTHFIIRKTTKAPLGNHYHREKTETFMILDGSGILTYAEVVEIDGKVSLFKKPETIELSGGTVVQILPYTSHAFHLEEGSVMVCFSSRPFDSNDMPSCKII